MQMVGFVIGVVPSFKQAFIGQTAPLRVIRDSADLLRYDSISLPFFDLQFIVKFIINSQ